MAITIENLGKSYTLRHQRAGGQEGLRHLLQRTAMAPWQWWKDRRTPADSGQEEEEFWALREISCQIEQGEVVGIIGRNGAGKSTLLKILSRIVEPTAGRVVLQGRVASLLEVGTGFHPELTGRENIFLNGAILGMSRKEIRSKFDEIVAFAEVEQFLDTPVKRYSSGMHVRLAFAVAAHLEPEILIVDEVLAVGDSAFQAKCLGKMRDLSTRETRTVLFVSHDMTAINTLTSRALLLDRGRLILDAPTEKVLGVYFNRLRQKGDYCAVGTASEPRITLVSVQTSEGNAVQVAGKSLTVTVEVENVAATRDLVVSFQIINQFHQAATHVTIDGARQPFANPTGTARLICRMPSVRLNIGQYYLRVFFSEPPGGRFFDRLEGVCNFEVIRLTSYSSWGLRADNCVYHEDVAWEVEEK